MTKRDCPSAAGFSLVEMMLVIGLMAVLTGMAVTQIGIARPGMKGDGAMRVILGQMNQARGIALSQRRYVQVVFTSPNLMQIIREDTINTTTTLSSSILEGGVQFAIVSGVPDTPDAFGATTAISFGAVTNVKFTPDGRLVNQDGATANGTVFLAVPLTALSSRAVTVLGSTGRIRGYKWDGRQWKVV
jgi:prepilin-type N-terminal cleavage/methylation domain-containing protein